MIPFSVLDLSPINKGSTAAQAFNNTKELAQLAEKLGYRRYWLAEHHNMAGIASAATSLVISHVAANTRSIRVGSGGIMLPNHSPLVIAEQFGTLESLYPGRIDLGLGRAPGSDQRTARALRRNMGGDTAENFPQDVQELQDYFAEPSDYQSLRAVPGAGLNVPIWLLGSSMFSAQLAAELGLPFAFASHFAPGFMKSAVEIYRARFKPSAAWPKPYVMLGLNVFAADTGREAVRLFSSLQQQFINLIRGTPGQLNPPVDDIADYWQPGEQAHVERSLACAVVGDRESVREGLQNFIDDTAPDELMITAQIYDHAARLHSFEIVAEVRQELEGRVAI
ncbi:MULTISPECIES: LLM class flavin-dependent oxidoreductase [unclassified Herbaspirillum]|uniref:LLM class flavin-dependent oxidoreductase n=1 Tax=unclassified Herbaspirillum TaxID=2624150 RepID=UPI001152FDDB|nr:MULTISPECIES: LLM class flavin-dependent oxidoreductase [unclassified Herbaspirillum]MBB5391564.1 luciferase family oxidoreductase group 1 [Herbaspirillum sp. SJZ102]TQK12753.1 luciferase family oxidoreductase group 1 [Herbaspirillum sp. SJZ130]TQK14757.1 luciferase family oxidoreductase group 1 [Herbaspirillum sp. SJZ106]TWC62843.1 luciferase family oxidoreductase group 1 [Herbaspirillum sp. SJZ099]